METKEPETVAENGVIHSAGREFNSPLSLTFKNLKKGVACMQNLVSRFVRDPTDQEIIDAIQPTTEKLQRIILREGDADGDRLKPSYIARLIAETIISNRKSEESIERYKEKRRVAEANTPITTLLIVAH